MVNIIAQVSFRSKRVGDPPAGDLGKAGGDQEFVSDAAFWQELLWLQEQQEPGLGDLTDVGPQGGGGWCRR